MCYKLSQPISRVRFDEDCPLPRLTDVEKYLRYITKDGKLDCCGNCKDWEYYGYDDKDKKDKGYCKTHDQVMNCDSYSSLCFKSI